MGADDCVEQSTAFYLGIRYVAGNGRPLFFNTSAGAKTFLYGLGFIVS